MKKIIDNFSSGEVDEEAVQSIINRVKKPHIKLNDWFPAGACLIGECVDHPQLGSTFMNTSLVIFFDEENGVAETLNTVYLLGPKRAI
jgi:hypothetical protein